MAFKKVMKYALIPQGIVTVRRQRSKTDPAVNLCISKWDHEHTFGGAEWFEIFQDDDDHNQIGLKAGVPYNGNARLTTSSGQRRILLPRSVINTISFANGRYAMTWNEEVQLHIVDLSAPIAVVSKKAVAA